MTVRLLRSDELTGTEVVVLRELFEAAWPDPEEAFSDDDWDHAVGGIHAIDEIDGRIVAHGSVVPRVLEIGGRPIRTGYVEAVAVSPARQGRGHGTAVMRALDEIIRRDDELGALGTGEFHFYERLGWERWPGPTGFRTDGGVRRTPDDDGYVMVLRTPSTPIFDTTALITCDWRAGDVW